MGIAELLLIAFALSMDAFAVSVTNGMTMIKLRAYNYIVIALFYGLFQAAMPTVGYFIGKGVAFCISAYAPWVALILLGAIGGKMIADGIKCLKENECAIRRFSIKLILLQAFATSIDALMVGVTFAAVGVYPLPYVFVIGGITFCLALLGVYVGKHFGDVLKSKSELFGGAILLLVGIKIFLEGVF